MNLELEGAKIGLEDIAPRADFELAVAEGWVNCQQHPTAPYEIWNYSKKAQYDRHWTPVTRAARGLITQIDTGEIVARPFPKFFNAGEDEIEIPLHEPVVVTEKVDGSLGILHELPEGELAFATRGSFISEQSMHATQVLRKRYPKFSPEAAYTYLFEIIYPENRIVLDYGDMDDLILLGAVDKATGRSLPLEEAAQKWPGPVVETYPFRSFTEVVREDIEENHEGFVVHFLESDLRLKVKSDWYFRLHRLFTGTSAKTIWENLVAGLDVESAFSELPSEFSQWAIDTASRLRTAHRTTLEEVEAEFQELVVELGEGYTRKDFALAVAERPTRGYLFARLDNRDLSPMVWKNLRPASEKPFASDPDEAEVL